MDVSRRKDNFAAFTLIELLVVLVILAIAAAIVIPSFSGLGELEVTSAARTIAADLQYAQNMSITFQEPVTVTFDTGDESYTLSNESGPLIHPMTKSAYTVAFSNQKGFENLDIVSADFAGGATVTFDELGAPDNAGAVTVQSGRHAYRIDVSAATGKVTVTDVGS